MYSSHLTPHIISYIKENDRLSIYKLMSGVTSITEKSILLMDSCYVMEECVNCGNFLLLDWLVSKYGYDVNTLPIRDKIDVIEEVLDYKGRHRLESMVWLLIRGVFLHYSREKKSYVYYNEYEFMELISNDVKFPTYLRKFNDILKGIEGDFEMRNVISFYNRESNLNKILD